MPTVDSPIVFSGGEELTGCPMEMLTPAVFDLMELAAFAEEGELPMGGGPMQQTESFLAMLRHYRRENAEWDVKLKVER